MIQNSNTYHEICVSLHPYTAMEKTLENSANTARSNARYLGNHTRVHMNRGCQRELEKFKRLLFYRLSKNQRWKWTREQCQGRKDAMCSRLTNRCSWHVRASWSGGDDGCFCSVIGQGGERRKNLKSNQNNLYWSHIQPLYKIGRASCRERVSSPL